MESRQIKDARLVANPGCYPTSAILAIAPFVAAGVAKTDSLIVDSASGTSGAGRSSFGQGMHHPEVHSDFKAYGVGTHRHTPEIEQGISDALSAEQRVLVTFTPHLLPIARGILTTSYIELTQRIDTAEAHRILSERYASEPFVRVHPAGELPQLKHTVGSNFCDIGAVVDTREGGRLIVVSSEDNLVKGAAGQAVQNMNLMSGFEETTGLMFAPLFP
jgi:N-acetyl-gamma-glutamyl-phosphate reductase